jgi:hypothetical protein
MPPEAITATVVAIVRFNFDGDLDEISHERFSDGSKTITSWRATASPTFGWPPSITANSRKCVNDALSTHSASETRAIPDHLEIFTRSLSSLCISLLLSNIYGDS